MLRVRRASTPLRIHASSCFQNVSNLRLRDGLRPRARRPCAPRTPRSCPGYERSRPRSSSTMRVVDAVEERAVVRDDDRRRLLAQQLLEQRDAVDVEMIGRLVEQQQVGRQRERQRERRALALAARTPTPGSVASSRPKRCRNSTSRASTRQRSRSSCACSSAVARPPRSARLSRSVDAGGSTGSCSTSTMRRPSRRLISPSSRSARPAITLSSDDLPVPLRPMRPMRSPSSTSARRGRAADAGRTRARRPGAKGGAFAQG